ncbi:MAG: fused MFS/spermidine synthase [Planctomycetes bacterium]|nr:fused MFS/spermidine synthase [Planctomycetota bacterium]
MAGRSSFPLVFVAFAAGAATMTVELAAVRLLAPWYGTSSAVWTNVIGVVLAALSLGYLAGARVSAAPDPRRLLGLLLVAAGAASAWLPWLARPVARLFLPDGLTLEEAGPALASGSLASALLLFAPPAFLLGTIAPLVAEALERGGRATAGAATGRVLAASTLGSLLGTFGTTYVFVPEAGLSATYLGAGAALAGLGLPFLVATRARAPALAGLALVGAALWASRTSAPALPAGVRLLESRETLLQSARVVESGDGPERMRRLEVNESLGSFQSVWQPEPGPLPAGYYYNAFALPAWWGRPPGAWRVLVLGLGAGTAWRVLEGALPPGVEFESTGVEIDPGVVELGRRWMDLPGASRADRIVAAGVDGRAALRFVPQRFDLLVLDAYQNQVEIPPQLASVEFFAEAARCLASDGILVANVGAFGLDDPVLEALARTMAKGFERRVLAVRVPFSRNVALFARVEGEPPDPRSEQFAPPTGPLARLAASMALDGGSRWFEVPERAPLDDDRNPILSLQRASVERAARSRP